MKRFFLILALFTSVAVQAPLLGHSVAVLPWFEDSDGVRHVIFEKVPLFGGEDRDKNIKAAKEMVQKYGVPPMPEDAPIPEKQEELFVSPIESREQEKDVAARLISEKLGVRVAKDNFEHNIRIPLLFSMRLYRFDERPLDPQVYSFYFCRLKLSSEEISKISQNKNIQTYEIKEFWQALHGLHNSTVGMDAQAGILLCLLQFVLLGLGKEFSLIKEHIFIKHPDLFDQYSRCKASAILISIKDKEEFDEDGFEKKMKDSEVSSFKNDAENTQDPELKKIKDFASEWL